MRRAPPNRPQTAHPRRVISEDVVAVVAVEEKLGTAEDNRAVSVRSAEGYEPNRRPMEGAKPSAKLIMHFRTNRERDLAMNLGTNFETNRGAIALNGAMDT